ncbi:hypothetical protein ANN_04630 [Periplaneta americana]|uniref:Uncharacterized protein n=1 Tax=Periplaneta americana TaxID=6978 RepID=A0ABQ8TAZ6_PERAM|nr:hypothetical protein ANN_04630 [Periplaneta americana]
MVLEGGERRGSTSNSAPLKEQVDGDGVIGRLGQTRLTHWPVGSLFTPEENWFPKPHYFAKVDGPPNIKALAVGLVGAVGIALAFCARGCGFDLGPGRWHLSVLKCDRLMSIDGRTVTHFLVAHHFGGPHCTSCVSVESYVFVVSGMSYDDDDEEGRRGNPIKTGEAPSRGCEGLLEHEFDILNHDEIVKSISCYVD